MVALCWPRILQKDDAEMTESWLDFSNNLARKIREARQAAGLTQAELARRAETRQVVISRLESVKNDCLPTVQLLKRIADALGLNLHIEFGE